MDEKGKKERHGQYTGELGKELYKTLQVDRPELGLKVFFAHRNTADKEIEGVPMAVPHLGKRSGRASSLSYVDIAIAKGTDMLILCEAEEEDADPKKIIGDICNILLSDHIGVRGQDSYNFSLGHIILGLKVDSIRSSKPSKAEDLRTLIVNRFQDKKDLKIIIVTDTNTKEMLRKVRKMIIDILSQEIGPSFPTNI